MGNQLSRHLVAFVVPVVDIHEQETANDGATNNSSYTQSTPRPGLPVADDELSTLVPVVSGAQDDDLVLTVLQGGSPGITGSSLQLGYRYDSETATELRGWSAPNALCDWDDVYYVTAATGDFFDAVTHPDDQRVLVAYGDAAGSTTRFSRWRPDTATWSTLSSLTSASTTSSVLCILPTGRVLFAPYGGRVRRSDDFGTSWAFHSTETIPQLDRPKMVAVDGELLLVGCAPGTSTLEQWASSDGGATFDQVETIATFGTKLSLCPLPDGRIVIVYRRNSDGYPCSRTIGSPWDPVSGADAHELKAAAITDLCATADPDGLLWAYATLSAAVHTVYAFGSVSYGENWSEFDFGAATVSTSSADSLRPMVAVSTQGQVMVLSKFVASTDNHDESIVSLRFGGWSSGALGVRSSDSGIIERVGYGPHGSLAPVVWLPIELPNNAGWTGTGAGTGSLVSGRLNISTTAQLRHYDWIPGTDLSILVQAGLKVNSGGSVSTRAIALTVAVASGVHEYRVDVRFSTTQFRVHDPNGAAGAGTDLATVTYTTTAELDILVEIDNTAAKVLYKRPYEAVYAVAWQGTLTDAAVPAATGIVDFGNIASATADSDWRFVALCPQGLTDDVGRPISTIPVPLHCEVTDGTLVGRLSAIGGQGALLEDFTVAAEHDYPATAVYPQISPSPAAKWRTTSLSEQKRAWLFDDAILLGEEIHQAIIALGCNFRLAYLEEEQAGWNIVATLDLAQGFAGINYTLTNAVLTGGAGGVAPGRFVGKNELRGGYAVVETGGGAGTVARVITGNTPGWWSSSSSTKQLRVFLEGVAGTEDASGQCDLVWPSGIAFNFETSVRHRTRWRIRIPSGQVTPYDYYEAGVLVPGAVHVPGSPPDWGYSRESKPNLLQRRTPYGTSFARELGPPLRTEVIGWSEGTADLSFLRASATGGDYLGLASQVPMAAAEDVPWFLEGLQVYTKSGEVPMVYVKSLPTADGTLTDPSLILYGRWASSVGYDHEVSDEDVGEVVRPIGLTIEEIR